MANKQLNDTYKACCGKYNIVNNGAEYGGHRAEILFCPKTNLYWAFIFDESYSVIAVRTAETIELLG